MEKIAENRKLKLNFATLGKEKNMKYGDNRVLGKNESGKRSKLIWIRASHITMFTLYSEFGAGLSKNVMGRFFLTGASHCQ